MVLLDGLRSLDFRPATHQLAASPVLVARRRLSARSRRCELIPWRGVLLHLDDDALCQVAAPADPAPVDPAVWTGVGGVHPALDGGPLVLGRDGAVRRWAPDSAASAPLLTVGARHEDVGLAGLADDRLHVRRYDTGTTTLHDLRSGEVVWRRDALSVALVPIDDAVLESDLAEGRDLRLTELADGAERWRTTVPGVVQGVVAVVGPTAWAAVSGTGLLAVDVGSGEVVGRLDAPYADTHTATVAPDGRAVWTTGLDVVVVDLVRGVLDAHVAFAGTGHAAAGGGLLRCAVDGRVVLSDVARQVWLVEPGDLAHPRLLHRAESTITGLEISGHAVHVLTDDGTLAVLG